VDVEGGTIKITYDTPQGEKTDWWGMFTGFLLQLPTILIAILFIFIVIELVRIFRR